jgi:hypothetical protein
MAHWRFLTLTGTSVTPWFVGKKTEHIDNIADMKKSAPQLAESNR